MSREAKIEHACPACDAWSAWPTTPSLDYPTDPRCDDVAPDTQIVCQGCGATLRWDVDYDDDARCAVGAVIVVRADAERPVTWVEGPRGELHDATLPCDDCGRYDCATDGEPRPRPDAPRLPEDVRPPVLCDSCSRARRTVADECAASAEHAYNQHRRVR